MGVNLTKLRIEFEKQFTDSSRFKTLARGAALSRIRAAQREMVNTFEAHPVTKELEGGVDYNGPSLIKYHNSEHKANLYSFIGFPKGTNPLDVLRKLLLFPIDVRLSTRVKNTYYFVVLSPTTDDIEKATPMPTDYLSGTFSWARGIEDGDLLGIENFLSIKVSASRSGGGIQVELGSPLDSTIATSPYITDILEAFRKRLQLLIK